MPSNATITSYYTFSANTKARASQVNFNFSIYRGHNIPIDPNTATGSDNNYNLGSKEYRWANLYTQNVHLGNTSTNNAILNIDSATSTGEMVFKLNNTEKMRLKANGLKVHDDLNVTGSISAAAIKSKTGYNISPTISAGIGGIAYINLPGATSATTTSTLLAGSTITIESIGNPIEIRIASSNSASVSYIQANGGTSVPYLEILLYRDGSYISGFYTQNLLNYLTGTVDSYGGIRVAPSFSVIDFPSSGSHNYYLYYKYGNINTQCQLLNCILYAKEIMY